MRSGGFDEYIAEKNAESIDGLARALAAEAAAARRLDPDDVARAQLPRHLRGLLLAVHERAPGRAVLAAVGAARSVRAPLGEHREPAVLEHAQLAHDAVAAAVRARRRPSPRAGASARRAADRRARAPRPA